MTLKFFLRIRIDSNRIESNPVFLSSNRIELKLERIESNRITLKFDSIRFVRNLSSIWKKHCKNFNHNRYLFTYKIICKKKNFEFHFYQPSDSFYCPFLLVCIFS